MLEQLFVGWMQLTSKREERILDIRLGNVSMAFPLYIEPKREAKRRVKNHNQPQKENIQFHKIIISGRCQVSSPDSLCLCAPFYTRVLQPHYVVKDRQVCQIPI